MRGPPDTVGRLRAATGHASLAKAHKFGASSSSSSAAAAALRHSPQCNFYDQRRGLVSGATSARTISRAQIGLIHLPWLGMQICLRGGRGTNSLARARVPSFVVASRIAMLQFAEVLKSCKCARGVFQEAAGFLYNYRVRRRLLYLALARARTPIITIR